MSKPKKKPLPPRRKRMNRRARLASARHGLPAFGGQNVVRGYARWFGVDHLCAVKELGMLGVTLDRLYVARLERTHREKGRASAEARARKKAASEAHGREPEDDSDDGFAFVAGRTTGGYAYGLTWEEDEAFEDPPQLRFALARLDLEVQEVSEVQTPRLL